MNRFTIIALAGLLLAGCIQLGGVSDSQQAQQLWALQQQSMQRVDNWDMRARAVIAFGGAAYNVGIHWQRQPDRFVMLIEAPFGHGIIRIDSLPGEHYQLSLPDGRILHRESPEALLEDTLGWSIPISGLEYWIRGLPRPGRDYTHRIDKNGLAKRIRQDKWSIVYLGYFRDQDLPRLPRRINLGGNIMTMKLVIEHWQQVRIDEAPSDLFPEFN